jgi:hypothetical protein
MKGLQSEIPFNPKSAGGNVQESKEEWDNRYKYSCGRDHRSSHHSESRLVWMGTENKEGGWCELRLEENKKLQWSTTLHS